MSNDERRPRLVVNGDKCQGHNRCHVLVPELITVDDLGFAQIRGDGRVPPELEVPRTVTL